MPATVSDPYLISAAAGLVCSILLLIFLGTKVPHDRKQMAVCGMFAFFFMFVGAHLLFFLVNLPEFSSKYGPSIFDFQSFFTALLGAASGMVFYGGLFGAIAGVCIFCRIMKVPVRTFMNPLACVFPLMHAFGRLGCTLGGCCYGIEYHGILAIHYTSAQINPGISDNLADFPRFPVQPLEAVCELLLCVFLVLLYLKTQDRFSLVLIYLFTYGVIRFLDEFLRGDTVRGIWGPFSTSQWIALGCIIVIAAVYLLRKKGRRSA